MNYSLRQLLLVSLLSAAMLIWGIAAYVSYKQTRDEVANLFDAELSQSAKVLHAFVESLLREGSLSAFGSQEHLDKNLHDYALKHKFKRKNSFQLWSGDNDFFAKPDDTPNVAVHGFDKNHIDSQLWYVFDDVLQANALGRDYERKIAFQLWSKKDGLLLRSESAPKFVFSKADEGFSNANIDGHLWHVFSISDSTGQYVVHVGQKEEIRAELTDEISSHTALQLLLGLPFLGLVIWIIVGHCLKPLDRLERSLSKREASYLKPLSTRKLPNEIVPVVNEINNLFAQLEQAFEHERRFTSDAAHELRTPLAGLLTQAQVALRTNDDEVRKQALKRIEQAVNRMTYMVQQLLTFSRIESSSEFLTQEAIQLGREVVQIVAELEPEAYKKRISMEFVETNPVPVLVNPQLMAILIRNILDNAIKYTPAKGSVLISLVGKDNKLQLSVEDSGPGISPDQYEKSLQRFHRCTETAHTAPGTGLGFSIVERIAAIHNADLILGVSQLGGLKVTISFPLPTNGQEQPWQKKLSFFNNLSDKLKAQD
ncbi:ATP-binding protein [Methylovulum miyakonense]|uniref:ATP-binding protein n=1 Tax=Methylovulum miyakonense TaxID=645578 RepID=UPI00037BD407|nr:ATP-binding protein [Methylovulum miyakonense]